MRHLAPVFILVLAGCASYDGRGLKPGASSEAEVRALMGPPALELASQDGGKRLAYPKGPLGTQTFMIDVGRDGVFHANNQVLSDDVFNGVRPGQTREDILYRIGPPGETMEFARTGNVAWDYRYVDTWGYLAIFSVTFDPNGVVVSKLTRRLQERQGTR